MKLLVRKVRPRVSYTFLSKKKIKKKKTEKKLKKKHASTIFWGNLGGVGVWRIFGGFCFLRGGNALALLYRGKSVFFKGGGLFSLQGQKWLLEAASS